MLTSPLCYCIVNAVERLLYVAVQQKQQRHDGCGYKVYYACYSVLEGLNKSYADLLFVPGIGV